MGRNNKNILVTNTTYNKELERKLDLTIKFLSNTLSNTLGPHGKTTIIQDRHLHQHLITKDGYSLLKKIHIEDNSSLTFLDIIKSISRNQVRKVGDGSTSSIIIAYALRKHLKKLRRKFNYSTKDLLDVMNELVRLITDIIREKSIAITDDNFDRLKDIAAISSNNDYNYGKLIFDAQKKVGRYGFIDYEASPTEKTYVRYKRGFEIDRGFIDDCMATDADRENVTMADPYILMYDDVILEEQLPIISNICGDITGRMSRPIAFICKGYDPAISNFFKLNVQQNNLPIVAIEIATSGSFKKTFEDLSIYLGCKPYSRVGGNDITNQLNDENFGRCKKLTVGYKLSRFIDGQSNGEELIARIDLLKKEIDKYTKTEGMFDREMEIHSLRRRIAKLSAETAIIYVGGKSEIEKHTDKALIEDAVLACRSTLENGYIIGGNLIIPMILSSGLLRTRITSDESLERFDSTFVDAVLDIFNKAFKESFMFVLKNKNNRPFKNKKILNQCIKSNKIYNLKTGKFQGIEETGVINSAQTDIEILKGACSIVGLLTTSNQFISSDISPTKIY